MCFTSLGQIIDSTDLMHITLPNARLSTPMILPYSKAHPNWDLTATRNDIIDEFDDQIIGNLKCLHQLRQGWSLIRIEYLKALKFENPFVAFGEDETRGWAGIKAVYIDPLNTGGPNDHNGGWIQIPTKFKSRATIEYLGFTYTRAREIWSAWSCYIWAYDLRKSATNGDFLTFVLDQVGPDNTDARYREYRGRLEESDEAYQYLIAQGVNISVLDDLMTDYFRTVRIIEDCRGWLQVLINARWEGLLKLQLQSLWRKNIVMEMRAGWSMEDYVQMKQLGDPEDFKPFVDVLWADSDSDYHEDADVDNIELEPSESDSGDRDGETNISESEEFNGVAGTGSENTCEDTSAHSSTPVSSEETELDNSFDTGSEENYLDSEWDHLSTPSSGDDDLSYREWLPREFSESLE